MSKEIDCIEQGICPRCSNELYYRTWKEDRGEYQGSSCYENCGEYICEECGYTY